MSENVEDSLLERDILRAMNGELLDVVPSLLQSELVVPSGGPVGERFVGFVPVLYDRDGVAMLAAFTTFDRARSVAHLAPYAMTMLGSDLIVRMPEGHGLVVNPGFEMGFELPPEGVARVKALVVDDEGSDGPGPE